MSPKEAVDTLANLAANRIAANGEEDATAAWMLGVRACIEALAAGAAAQRDKARLDYVLPKVFMTREDIDWEMGPKK